MPLRDVTPQRGWGSHGEVCITTAKGARVDRELVSLVTDEIAFYQAINKLLLISLIQTHATDTNRSRSFSVRPLLQHSAS